ncbi:uteroglobin [Nannospalax galili]|uniref:Uteroglobin n=1 Tax=Nannospalax galili TaxID=1026970 RepID=A0A8C6R675_NANGA|nr:uteroglobin [Nannospalax galili]
MKLALTLTLVMLAHCCSSASAEVCPGFLKVLETLFMDSSANYNKALQFFNPDPVLQDAAMQLKKLVDTLSLETKGNNLKLADKILTSLQCKQDLGI